MKHNNIIITHFSTESIPLVLHIPCSSSPQLRFLCNIGFLLLWFGVCWHFCALADDCVLSAFAPASDSVCSPIYRPYSHSKTKQSKQSSGLNTSYLRLPTEEGSRVCVSSGTASCFIILISHAFYKMPSL